MSKEITSREYGAFGEVLTEIMGMRGLTPDMETLTNLAIYAGLDPLDLEHEMYSRPRESGGLNVLAGDTHALSWVLCLTEAEKRVFSMAFAFREGDAEALREARATDEHKAERERPSDSYPHIYPRPFVQYFDIEHPRGPHGTLSPCWVGRSPLVERCQNDATMSVYGVNLCPVHGEESAAGAREELTGDAVGTLERVPYGDNIALRRACLKAQLQLSEITHLAAESTEDRLREAFPKPPLVNDFEIPHHFALRHDEPELDSGPPWVDSLRETRHNTHALMRRAYQMGEGGLVEDLEDDRQSTAVLLSYAFAIERGEYPEHVEEVRRREAATPEP